MSEKNVVDIDEKAPQLKAMRRKRANRRFMIFIGILSCLILFVLYLESPYSDVQSVVIQGNEYVEKSWVTEASGLYNDVSMWALDEQSVQKTLTENDIIADVTLERNWPTEAVIHIDEHSLAAYLYDDDQHTFIPLLENGTLVESAKNRSPSGKVPLLYGFLDSDRVGSIAEEIAYTDRSVMRRISEIHFDPEDSDPSGVMVYMTDGFPVRTTVTNFHERIDPYPAIIEQLDREEDGLIHMRLNPYFESFEDDDSDEEEEDVLDDGQDVIEHHDEEGT
ncbi:cell division protein FtsQ/DivIB [Salisediminibacterium halotolerans]|uniref:cell division protein FtsQ/DivIB n=1 Tax=Salisediminibacterium halotolerans TaxID=517425 RepID=UPI000EAE9616|nr:FtsQ-type POTRA domain-containing protein [Salisediminibacterium halotolerans]RLJ74305.1 cell division protein FtsQ [Actinophytocola xinjiangensis]RPE87602.1 cell division protein FtsQ [Salisediminibacterium halotolerans]TWG35142.1 cell division protein FtsQ [Salisediminibacterium halotolerans]GEL07299.1 hypothetical protein SHA02_07150 [Salisediminibacterium halotolerans]